MLEFQIKPLNEILENVLKENTLSRKLKCIFLFEKYYINKSRVQNLIKEVQDKKSYTLYRDLIYLISRKKLSDELKLDSYLSIFSFFYSDFSDNISAIKYFIESFCKTNFKFKKGKNPEFNRKFKKLTIILISDLFEKLDDDNNKNYLVPLITSLFDSYYKLVKTNVTEGDEYIRLFEEIFNSITLDLQNLKKWSIHFDYYLTVKDDLDATFEVLESFLIKYTKDWRKEMYRDRYPNPVKFLETVYERFSEVKKQKNFITFLLDYYKQRTTDYIPSFFLRKKELNDPGILKIIENNLNNKNFDPKYLIEVRNILINHRPDKQSFNYYCNTIAALQKQYFTITSIRPADFKKLNIDQLFKIFVVIYRKNPEIREYPSNLFQFFIGNKRNMTNQALLQNYLEIIKISENFREFCDFCKHFYDFNDKLIKNINLEFGKIFESLIEKSEFSTFKKLFTIFKARKEDFFLIEVTKSLEEYIKKEFTVNSLYLISFLYTYFINIAREDDNHDTVLKLSNEFQSFIENLPIIGNTIDIILGREPLRKENYEIEFNNLISLIRSGKKAELKEFLEKSVKKELERPYKDLSKIAFIEFLLGNFMKSREYFQKKIDYLEEPRFYSSGRISEKLIEDDITISKFFIELTDFEINSAKLGSIIEFKRQLSNIFDKYYDCREKINYLYPHIWHFPLFTIYLHYFNLYNFCNFLEELKKDSRNRNLEFHLNKLINTEFCYEWDNIKKLWENTIKPSMLYENNSNLSSNQYEIFNRNPLFKGIRDVLKITFPRDSRLNQIFNYKPIRIIIKENLKKIFIQPNKFNKDLTVFKDESGKHNKILKYVKQKIDNMREIHYLNEPGIDLILENYSTNWKIGIAIEATSDIKEFKGNNKVSFFKDIFSKITKSKQIPNLDLFLIFFCIDITDKSYNGKVRYCINEIEKLKDDYVLYFLPEDLLGFFEDL